MTTLAEGRPSDIPMGFSVNDQVRIVSGWFENRIGTIQSVDPERRRVKVLVEETSIDLDVSQVEKM